MDITIITSHGAPKAWINGTNSQARVVFERWKAIKYSYYLERMASASSSPPMNFKQWEGQSNFQLVRLPEAHDVLALEEPPAKQETFELIGE